MHECELKMLVVSSRGIAPSALDADRSGAAGGGDAAPLRDSGASLGGEIGSMICGARCGVTLCAACVTLSPLSPCAVRSPPQSPLPRRASKRAAPWSMKTCACARLSRAISNTRCASLLFSSPSLPNFSCCFLMPARVVVILILAQFRFLQLIKEVTGAVGSRYFQNVSFVVNLHCEYSSDMKIQSNSSLSTLKIATKDTNVYIYVAPLAPARSPQESPRFLSYCQQCMSVHLA